MVVTKDPFELTWDRDSSLYRDSEGDPFCPTCYDRDMKRMHLLKDGLTLYCHACGFRKVQESIPPAS